MSTGLRFSVLGPLQGWRGADPLDLGPARQQALLAVLLLSAGRPVPPDELLAAGWTDAEMPTTGTKVLPPYVYRLRKILGDGAVPRSGGGYRLAAADTDLDRFDELVGRAAEHAADDPEKGSALLADALTLWRGTPLAGLPGPYAQEQRRRLADRHLAALERRIELDLGLGRHGTVLAELLALRAQHPGRERLAGMTMLALYRCGRQAEALAVYGALRRELRDTRRPDPGPELVALQAAVLRADPELLAAPRRDTPGPPRYGRRDLPRPTADFAGRAVELTALLAERSGGPRTVTLDGMAGVGKTTLAVHAAHLLAERYPDGQVFLPLHGHTPDLPPRRPADALGALLRAVGVEPARMPTEPAELAERWQAELADRRLLLVLDDAADRDQVLPLLATGPGCLTLVTSRRRLADLPGAEPIPVAPLSEVEGAALLLDTLAPDRRAGQEAHARRVVELCGGLPLAIRITSSRLRHRPSWTLQHVAAQLDAARADTARPSALAAEHRRVDEAFQLSYEQLEPAEQRVFRLLGLVPGSDFDTHAAAAVTDRPTAWVGRVLDDLLDVNLLQRRQSGRYVFHDLLREYAAGLAGAERADGAATGRLADYYLHVTVDARRKIRPDPGLVDLTVPVPPAETPALPDQDAALRWLDTEAGNIVATARACAATHPDRTWKLAAAAAKYLTMRNAVSLGQDLLDVGLAASRRLDHRLGESVMLFYLGNLHSGAGHGRRAVDYYEQALRLKRAVGDRVGEMAAISNLANDEASLGRYGDALTHLAQALELAAELGRDDLATFVRQNIGMVRYYLGHDEEALAALHTAVADARRCGLPEPEAWSTVLIGRILIRRGQVRDAESCVRAGLAIARRVDELETVAHALDALGVLHRGLGRPGPAVEHHLAAIATVDGLGLDQAEQVARIGYGDTLVALGRPGPAAAEFRRVVELDQRVGDPYYLARARLGLGDVAAAGGDRTAAAAAGYWTAALSTLTELGCAEADLVRARLDRQP